MNHPEELNLSDDQQREIEIQHLRNRLAQLEAEAPATPEVQDALSQAHDAVSEAEGGGGDVTAAADAVSQAADATQAAADTAPADASAPAAPPDGNVGPATQPAPAAATGAASQLGASATPPAPQPQPTTVAPTPAQEVFPSDQPAPQPSGGSVGTVPRQALEVSQAGSALQARIQDAAIKGDSLVIPVVFAQEAPSNYAGVTLAAVADGAVLLNVHTTDGRAPDKALDIILKVL